MLATATALLAVTLPPPTFAHNYLRDTEAPAGYVQDIVMRVPHGCKSCPCLTPTARPQYPWQWATMQDREHVLPRNGEVVDGT